MSGRKTDTGRGGIARGLILVGLLVAMLAAASPAQAQLPSICDDYPDAPGCQDPIFVPGSDGDPADVGSAGLGDADGNLPFTGYPVSSLILFSLLLLLLGLSARTASSVSKRIASRNAGTSA